MSGDETDCDYMDLVEEYVDKFGEGPPIFEMEDEEAIAKLKAALESGNPIAESDG